MLIHSYVTVVDIIINFQSWPAIIKYGADALVQKRSDDLEDLIKFGTLLEAFSALLGTAVAMASV